MSEMTARIPEALAADAILRKVLEERMMEEQMMKEKMMAEQQAKEERERAQKWEVQITEEVITEVTTFEPDSQDQHSYAVQPVDDPVRNLSIVEEREIDEADIEERVLGETFEEGILDLNGLDEKPTERSETPRPTTPKMRRTSVHDLLSLKEPSPERPVLSIQQRSARDPQHYSQFHSQTPVLHKRLSSAPLQNPPSMPLPAPPPSHMPSLSTRPSSRNAFAPPPVTGIRPGRRTSSIGSLAKSENSRSSSPVMNMNHSRQSSSAISNGVRNSPPIEDIAQKLRRPTSMQISSDHAPFLSTRRGGSFSQKPNRASAVPLNRQAPMFQGPYAASVLSKLQSSSSFSSLSALEVREADHEYSEKPQIPPFSAARAFSHSSAQRQASPAMGMSSMNDFMEQRSVTDPTPLRAQNLRAMSPAMMYASNTSSRDVSGQVSPSLNTPARSVSPTNSDISDSAILEVGSSIRVVSTPRLSFIGPAGGIHRLSSPPPLPPMNPSRVALRGKMSMPNMSSATLANLPPPMPPPNCPLPEVPNMPSPLHSPVQSPALH
jgi:hypothetical protein